MNNKIGTIDISIPKRRYYSDECGLTLCPECGSGLIEADCTILLSARSDTDEGEFLTSLCGSHFCNKCPVVVFDTDKLEYAARTGIRSDLILKYYICGIVDLDAIPDNKKKLAIGCDENPVPLVRFLPDLSDQSVIADKQQGRNELCLCGSGKKYKKCCGK